MKNLALCFALYLVWMASMPCTDQIVELHEHGPSLVDVAHTTGQSPFHENTCPTFCVCGCCAVFTIAVEPEAIVFKTPVAQPEEQLLHLTVPAEEHFTYPTWRPPQV